MLLGATCMNGTLCVPGGASPGSESKSMNHRASRFCTCQSRAGPLAIRPNRSSSRGTVVAIGSGAAVGVGAGGVLVGAVVGLAVGCTVGAIVGVGGGVNDTVASGVGTVGVGAGGVLVGTVSGLVVGCTVGAIVGVGD